MKTNYHCRATNRWIPALLGSVLFLFISMSLLNAQNRSRVGEYEISGPYHHGALTLFLIHGESTAHSMPILTLEEAMEQKLVKVYETGNVNELAIENLSSDHEVYIQAGDIVKGGRQDRTLGFDLSLAPNSGKVPIASFCVEKGRWSKRGEEADGEFGGGSNNMVTSNSLRFAIKSAKNQSEVWKEVSVVQTKLSHNLGVQVNAVGGDGSVVLAEAQPEHNVVQDQNMSLETANVVTTDEILNETILPNDINHPIAVVDNVSTQGVITQNLNDDTFAQVQERPANRILQGAFSTQSVDNDGAYTTSLQLSLENEQLIGEIDEYMMVLQGIIDQHEDVIGFAFTINGKMKNADVYASNDLFSRLWPKLLRAAATEAVAEKEEEEVIGTLQEVETCFLDAENAEAEEEKVNDRIKMVTRKSDENVLFETKDNKSENGWIHRNYMKIE